MGDDLPNSTLAILMILTIVISLGSLFFSLDRLSKIQKGPAPPQVTGYATGGSGQVNITILNFNSISIEDAFINFGNCTPTSGIGNNLSSNETSEPVCIATGSGTYPDNISVSNDGNTNINVTVASNVLSSALIGGTAPVFSFSTRNATLNGGCSNQSSTCGGGGVCGCNSQDNCTIQYDWQSFDSTVREYEACKNLTYGGTPSSRPRFYLFAHVFVPADATPRTASNATLTFTAHPPS